MIIICNQLQLQVIVPETVCRKNMIVRIPEPQPLRFTRVDHPSDALSSFGSELFRVGPRHDGVDCRKDLRLSRNLWIRPVYQATVRDQLQTHIRPLPTHHRLKRHILFHQGQQHGCGIFRTPTLGFVR
jgi:hypothetical protein